MGSLGAADVFSIHKVLNKMLAELDSLKCVVNKFKILYHLGTDCSTKQVDDYLDYLIHNM